MTAEQLEKSKKQEPRKFFNVGAKNLTELERYLKLIILVQGGRRERGEKGSG